MSKEKPLKSSDSHLISRSVTLSRFQSLIRLPVVPAGPLVTRRRTLRAGSCDWRPQHPCDGCRRVSLGDDLSAVRMHHVQLFLSHVHLSVGLGCCVHVFFRWLKINIFNLPLRHFCRMLTVYFILEFLF